MACVAHHAVYFSSKDLYKRTISVKILINRAYEIDINPEYEGCQRGLASMKYKYFNKKIGSRVNVNKVSDQELHKLVIKNFKKSVC